MWINSNTLVVYNYIYEIRQAFPDISFPEFPTDEDFETVGVYLVTQALPPEYNKITQELEQTVENINGTWTQVWTVVALSPEQIVANEEAARQSNKSQAESLLKASDWSQYPDVTNPTNTPHLTNGDAWMFYRLELRSIAINPPVTIENWPVKPEELWSTTV